MASSRVRTGHADGETPPNTYSDFEWAHDHERELLEQYGECIVLVYEKQVIGSGRTLAEAEHDAESRLAPEVVEVTPITVLPHYRHPFFRAWPVDAADK